MGMYNTICHRILCLLHNLIIQFNNLIKMKRLRLYSDAKYILHKQHITFIAIKRHYSNILNVLQ